jgi:hypothetical protein
MEAAKQAKAAGFSGLAVKNHDYCTAPLGQFAESSVENIRVYGGLVLNYAIGGLNPHAVEAASRLGSKIIWLPTFSAKSDRSEVQGKKELFLIEAGGKLVSGLVESLEIIRDRKIILATGHVGYEEIKSVVETAKAMQISKILINHPFRREGPALSLEQQESLVSKGAILEHCAFHFLKKKDPIPVITLVKAIKRIGSKNCSLASDLGQVGNPLPVDGLRNFVADLLAHGVTPQEIKTMACDNPLRLVQS